LNEHRYRIFLMFSRGIAPAFAVIVYYVSAVRAEHDPGSEILLVNGVSAAMTLAEEDEHAYDDEVGPSTVFLLQMNNVLSRTHGAWPGPPLLGAWPSGIWPEDQVKKTSMEEANLTCSDVSWYGAAVPKVPQSVVESVMALRNASSGKPSKYNFQGSVFGYTSVKSFRRRTWVVPFAMKHFSDDDVLFISDVPANYAPLGPYDKSNERDGYRPRDHPLGQRDIGFDADYYQIMVQSQFTLCPGGDSPWSMRFYEAILAGSIPVIDTVEHALDNYDVSFWFDQIGYTYFTTSQVTNLTLSNAELEDIADSNYKLMLQYQTWIQGDQVPPAYAAYRIPCHSDSKCSFSCSVLGNR